MNRFFPSLITVIILLAMLPPEKTESQSIFNSYGLGEMRYFIHARSAGLGGAGLAVRDPLKQNHMNPALWSDINNTSISAGLRFESLGYERSGISTNSRGTTINNFDINIKTTQKFTFGLGYHPYSDTDYVIQTISDDHITTLKVEGGNAKGYLGASYKVKDNVSIGLSYNLIFGKQNENWLIEFDDDNFTNSDNSYTRSQWGNGVTVGLKWDFGQRLTVGGIYTTPIEIKSTDRVSYYNEALISTPGGTASVPASFGIGFAGGITSQLQLAMDLHRWQMNDLEVDWSDDAGYRNSTRFSAGLEYFPQATYGSMFLKKWIYRCGYYYWDLYSVDVDGSPISEHFLSAGVTVPIGNNVARFDIALQAGLRRSESRAIGSERILRLQVDLTGGERWFIRNY